MGFSRFLRLKVSIQEPERSKKEKKPEKNSKYFNAYEKIIQGASPVWSPPTPLSHGRKGMVVVQFAFDSKGVVAGTKCSVWLLGLTF